MPQQLARDNNILRTRSSRSAATESCPETHTHGCKQGANVWRGRDDHVEPSRRPALSSPVRHQLNLFLQVNGGQAPALEVQAEPKPPRVPGQPNLGLVPACTRRAEILPDQHPRTPDLRLGVVPVEGHPLRAGRQPLLQQHPDARPGAAEERV